MYCPAGYVLNPRTRHCVIATGKTAADLVRRGNIAPIVGAAAVARRTVKRPAVARYGPARYGPTGYGPTGYGPTGYGPAAAGYGPAGYGPAAAGYGPAGYGPAAPAAIYVEPPCPYGQERNPHTRRCVKIGGRTHKKLRPAYHPPAYHPPAYHRRVATDPYVRSALAPLTDRAGILDWTRSQCRNQVDPLTGRAFVTEDTPALQQLVKLHTNTCSSSKALHRQIYIDGVEGRSPVVPGSFTPLTPADHAAIRASQGRTGAPPPPYGFPTTAAPVAGIGRRAPRPSEWQLYIAQDARSGPDYASVLIVDVTKARTTAYGVEYPAESIRVDLGYIPVTGGPGPTCTPQTLVDRIQRKDKRGSLIFLDPASGRWKPIAPFPLLKTFWTSSRAAKMAQLCSDLA